MNEFWAAIWGAIVGGCISALLQAITLYAASCDRRAARQLEKQRLGMTLLIKAIRVYSDDATFLKHIEDSPTPRDWRTLRPIANLPSPVDYDAEESANLFQLGESNVFQSIMMTDQVHNSSIGMFAKYGEVRSALESKLKVVGMENGVGSALVSAEQALDLAPLTATLEMMIPQMEERANLDMMEAKVAVDNLRDLLTRKLGVKIDVTLT